LIIVRYTNTLTYLLTYFKPLAGEEGVSCPSPRPPPPLSAVRASGGKTPLTPLALCRQRQLDVPTCRRSTIGGRAFPVAEAKLWNGLPSDVASASSLSVFKNIG